MSNKLNSIRDKEAKESYETDKQRMSNIKEAGIIGKRFFLVYFYTALVNQFNSFSLFNLHILAQASCVQARAISLVKKEQCTLPWYWKLIENDPENKFIRCNESYFLEPSKDPALKYLATVPQPNDTCKSESRFY